MNRIVELDRRGFLAGTAATTLAAGVPRALRAQSPKVLRIRSYGDLQVLDPAHRLAAPEDDIFRCLLPGLITYKPGTDAWAWELDAAEAIEQVDDTTLEITFRDPGARAYAFTFG